MARTKTITQGLKDELSQVREALLTKLDESAAKDFMNAQLTEQVRNMTNEMRLGVEAQAKRPYREIRIYVKDQLGREISSNLYNLSETDSFAFTSDGALSSAEHTKG